MRLEVTNRNVEVFLFRTEQGTGYVKNNPLKNRDADGHVCIFGIGNTCKVDPPPPPAPLKPPLVTQTGQVSRAQPGPQAPSAAPASTTQAAGQPQAQRGLTVGVGVAGNADVGVVAAGAEVNASAVVMGSISTSGRPSASAAASGGAVAYAGDNVAAAPTQLAPPIVLGAYAGAGVTLLAANTASGAQLSGPFQTISGNVGGGAGASVSLSFDSSGTFVFQVTVGPGIGASGWSVTTNTCVTGKGCQ